LLFCEKAGKSRLSPHDQNNLSVQIDKERP